MSTSFGAVAETYEAGRPDYPWEAVGWMLEPALDGDRPLRVADVGAGTGKLTRVVAAGRAEVVAIDPDPAMLAQLRDTVPGVPTFVGTAEQLPLPAASVDAVVLGQAWHWVDVGPASAEIGRVLRSGGVLGLVWNLRDDRDPWVRRMTEVMHGSNAENMMDAGGPTVEAPFDGLESEVWDWARPMTAEQLWAMMRSRSYIITASPADRGAIEERFAAVLAERPELAAGGTIDLPYRTHAFRARRP